MIDLICQFGTKIIALFMTACIAKYTLPEGNMKRSAEKAVDIAVLAGMAEVAVGVINNG